MYRPLIKLDGEVFRAGVTEYGQGGVKEIFANDMKFMYAIEAYGYAEKLVKYYEEVLRHGS